METDNYRCPLCNVEDVILSHLFLFCQCIQPLWFMSPWTLRKSNLQAASYHGGKSDPKLLLFASILTEQIRGERNKIVFEGGRLDLLRILVWDEDRNIGQAFSENVNFSDPDMAEVAGLLASARVAKDLGYEYVVFEGDCSNVFGRLMTSLDDVNWELRQLLLDCKVLLQSIKMWEIINQSITRRRPSHLSSPFSHAGSLSKKVGPFCPTDLLWGWANPRGLSWASSWSNSNIIVVHFALEHVTRHNLA
ncbi:hypothetical protein TorRG33x02_147200 [Trema orientale]|uniref:RNase H type-1 domain-containing protein n=1 Tax=Trema orientale TaxID=63057 RepID=A0A2P5EVK5_TREOI|nr:hypothetical protein TorRG33x02_147200 [Trema orientale]